MRVVRFLGENILREVRTGYGVDEAIRYSLKKWHITVERMQGFDTDALAISNLWCKVKFGINGSVKLTRSELINALYGDK